jgi:hypothetical protein
MAESGEINIRSTFLSDEDNVMLRIDMSQIEHRMCMMYCGTKRTVELANLHPSEYDAHTENAKLIFKKDKVTGQERYLGKKCVHGSERRMGGGRMSESISKDTNGELFIHPRQCDKLLRTFYDATPEIEEFYFPFVERQIRDVGMLYDSWGGRLDLKYRRVDNDLYKEGYSWYLQVEAARWTNQYLYLPMSHYMQATYGKPASAQVHDEVIVCVPWEDAYRVARIMVMFAQRTREIPAGSGNLLTVPAEVIVGSNWGDKRFEFKKLPGEGEFREIIYPLREEI